jgi:methylthioribulose-1-phosphate dehydratase
MTAFDQAASAIVDAGRRLDARGWAMAGAGNYSMRLDDGAFAVTVSGRHKGHLRPEDVMRVDAAGRSLDHRRPSAETLMHMAVYRARPDANAVLHTHSVPTTVLTRLFGLDRLLLRNYEMLKAFPSVETHKTEVRLPVFDNDQDMARLAPAAERALHADSSAPAFLLREHGLYVWGATMEQAIGAAEGAEFMLACELELLRLKSGGAT